MAEQIIAVQEDERAILGEELHDKIGSALSITRVKVETVQKKYADFRGNNELEDIKDLLHTIIREIRFIMNIFSKSVPDNV